jgi:hypothetical protein
MMANEEVKTAVESAKWCANTIRLNKKIGNRDIANKENDGCCYAIERCLQVIEQALDDRDKLHCLVAEMCDYIGLDDLAPYDDYDKIIKAFREYADENEILRVDKNTRKKDGGE